MTTATDVYSLGVVLYELLAGISPYDIGNASAQEIARIIRESEVQKPSLAVLRPRAESEAAAFGDVSPDKLRKQLSGDLDNIVLMALRKEPARRYASVNDLQEDIRRSLDNLPVIARHDTVWYRAHKFVIRHKAGVAAATAVAIVLIAGIVITLREARIADQRFNDVRALANSLIFDVHDSVKDLPGSTPARKIIVERALQYLNVLANDSSGDVGLQRELATAYERVGSVQGDYLENNLGDYAGTLVSYNKALNLRKRIITASHDWPDQIALAQSYRRVAHQMWANGDARGARAPIEHAIAVAQAVNQEQPNNMTILHELGADYEVSGRISYPGDDAAKQKVIADYRRGQAVAELEIKLQPNDIQTLHDYAVGLSEIGTMLEESDPKGALDDYRRSLEMERRLTGLSTDVRYRRGVAIAYGSIASVYDDLGDYPHALENNSKGLAIYQEMVSVDGKNALLRQGLAIAYINTAGSWARVGKFAQAIDDSRHGLEIMRSLVSSGPQHAFQQRIYAAMLALYGTVLIEADQPAAAIPEIEHARSIYESLANAAGTNHLYTAASDVKLGEACAKANRDQEAATYFHRALTVVEPLLSAQPVDLDAIYEAADAYSGLGELSMQAAQHAGLTAKQRKAQWSEARSWLQLSAAAWRRIEHPNHSAPSSFQAGDPTVVTRELKTAEAALAAQH